MNADDRPPQNAKRIYTIGHSTRTWDEFVALLEEFGVECVADVRSFPAGKRQPHFGRAHLERALPASGIGYVHLRGLGGFRRPRADSPNRGWRSRGFQAYADHMQSAEFQQAARELVRLAAERPTAALCAEAHFQRCHRQLLADWLVVHGFAVVHILGTGRSALHALTPFARFENGELHYPACG
ncbi:MAG: hypothetical protein KatS3mg077_1511 [Candidatus Binatia bacterium]|nr:MAG: hypothetical protein KatS3mg077_1511 [Candidatus Binatia bacterium]